MRQRFRLLPSVIAFADDVPAAQASAEAAVDEFLTRLLRRSSRVPGPLADRAGQDHVGAGDARQLSYRLCYRLDMARREKRSVSMPTELAHAIDKAAADDGTTFSAWLADTAAQRLRLESGRRGLAEWERDHGPLTAEELANGLARARSLLGRSKPRAARRSA